MTACFFHRYQTSTIPSGFAVRHAPRVKSGTSIYKPTFLKTPL